MIILSQDFISGDRVDLEDYPRLADKTQAEIYKLASDYLQIRHIAAEKFPTLIAILDSLADPANLPELKGFFTAKAWLAENGYKMTLKQQRHFYRAIAECHRFLTVTQPQKYKGVNYYSNLHAPLLKACAGNTLKLVRPTSPFIC